LNHFQVLVNQYCKEKKLETILWKDTSWETLREFVEYLETKDYIKLNSNKTRIESIISTRYKKSREIKNTSLELFELKDLNIPSIFEFKKSKISQKGDFGSPLKRSKSSLKTKVEPLPVMISQKIDQVCPICNKTFYDFIDSKIIHHIDECLTMKMLSEENNQEPKMLNQTPDAEEFDDEQQFPLNLSLYRSRFVVQQLTSDLNSSIECAICLDPFMEGQSVARVDCMCLFHSCCFNEWMKRSPYCPSHIPSNCK